MARAKRTERAIARRRSRAAVEGDVLETTDAASGPDSGARTGAPARPSAGVVRMGIAAALRASIHPFRPREDLAALPSLVTNKALWLPVLVTLASIVAVVLTGGKDAVTALLFAYFVQTPAIGGVFLAGFLAPRASWLLGAIIGLISAVGYVVVLSLVPGALTPTTPGTFFRATTAGCTRRSTRAPPGCTSPICRWCSSTRWMWRRVRARSI